MSILTIRQHYIKENECNNVEPIVPTCKVGILFSRREVVAIWRLLRTRVTSGGSKPRPKCSDDGRTIFVLESAVCESSTSTHDIDL